MFNIDRLPVAHNRSLIHTDRYNLIKVSNHDNSKWKGPTASAPSSSSCQLCCVCLITHHAGHYQVSNIYKNSKRIGHRFCCLSTAARDHYLSERFNFRNCAASGQVHQALLQLEGIERPDQLLSEACGRMDLLRHILSCICKQEGFSSGWKGSFINNEALEIVHCNGYYWECNCSNVHVANYNWTKT